MTEAREIERIVTMALDEDAPWGDLTGETLIPETAPATVST
jgi:nicotinate-nucleotide pyrophosphorylase (carboxylating)